jgi:hypothetical protein
MKSIYESKINTQKLNYCALRGLVRAALFFLRLFFGFGSLSGSKLDDQGLREALFSVDHPYLQYVVVM